MHTNPGAKIQEWLEANGKTQTWLAAELGWQKPFISKLVKGKAHISPKVAVRLEVVTRIPASTWLRHEMEYQLDRARTRA